MPKKPLAETHPELAKQWHPTLNGDLTARDVTPGSNKKVWWKCDKGVDHEWDTSPNTRTGQKQNVRYAQIKNIDSNCLATTHPEPVNNGILLKWTSQSFNTGSGSNKSVVEMIREDHEWCETNR